MASRGQRSSRLVGGPRRPREDDDKPAATLLHLGPGLGNGLAYEYSTTYPIPYDGARLDADDVEADPDAEDVDWYDRGHELGTDAAGEDGIYDDTPPPGCADESEWRQGYADGWHEAKIDLI